MADSETLGLVVPLGVLLFALAVALAARWVDGHLPRRRVMAGLEPGVVLFTSQRCPGCDPVRARLIKVLGHDGFREIKWTEEPQLFGAHRIDRVPTSAAVDGDGVGRVWEGMPSVRLLRRWKSFV